MKLKNYIKVFSNGLSPELCDAIIKEYHSSDEWQKTIVDNTENPNYRNCTSIKISEDATIINNPRVRKKIDESIFKRMWKGIDKYKEFCGSLTNFIGDSGFELVKYDTGGFYKEHVDSAEYMQRALSCSIQLNDDYKGGEWSFFGGTYTFKLKKGSMIFFPSNFLYPHQIKEVTDGIKYSIVTWII